MWVVDGWVVVYGLVGGMNDCCFSYGVMLGYTILWARARRAGSWFQRNFTMVHSTAEQRQLYTSAAQSSPVLSSVKQERKQYFVLQIFRVETLYYTANFQPWWKYSSVELPARGSLVWSVTSARKKHSNIIEQSWRGKRQRKRWLVLALMWGFWKRLLEISVKKVEFNGENILFIRTLISRRPLEEHWLHLWRIHHGLCCRHQNEEVSDGFRRIPEEK